MIVFEPEDLITTLAADKSLPAVRKRSLRKRELANFITAAADAAKVKGLICVLLTTDAVIRGQNRRFRGINKATDVLSFLPGDTFRRVTQIAGDIAISLETAARQAEAHGHPLQTEVKILILHAILHLAGMDHETDTGQMARRESALRKRFELPAGLIQRGGKPAAKPGTRKAATPAAKRKTKPVPKREAKPTGRGA